MTPCAAISSPEAHPWRKSLNTLQAAPTYTNKLVQKNHLTNHISKPSYSAHAVHHSPTLFGPDENAFRPERWILTENGGDEPSAEKLKAIEQNNELIFGYGKYQCLGKSVAQIELNKIYVELLRRFEFTLMDPLHAWKTKCFGIHLQSDMWVTVKRRVSSKKAG